MHRRTLTSLACILLAVSAARGQEASSLTADDLRAIVAKPHDDKPLPEGLAFLPHVRAWDATGNFIDAGGKRQPFKGKTTSKRVDGKYEVNQTRFEGHRVTLTVVVAWDPRTDTYYQYLVPPKGAPSKAVGIRVPDTRSIAWSTVGPGGPEMVTVETYADEKMTWRSVMVNKTGGVSLITEGEATPAKE